MNKLSKYILVGIALLSVLFASFSSAENVDSLIEEIDSNTSFSINGNSYKTLLTLSNSDYGVYCIRTHSISGGDRIIYGRSNTNNSLNAGAYFQIYSVWLANGNDNITCFYIDQTYLLAQNPVNTASILNYDIFRLDDLLAQALPIMSSTECQTEYNLIPINEVTANYCKLNFDLIDPRECPESSGTGAVNRTAWYINNEQYPGTASLNIFIPEFIKYSTTYNENETIVDIEGYNADTDYIEEVINNEKQTPTNEDFATLINGLISFIPYLFICLLFFRFVRIINRIWK